MCHRNALLEWWNQKSQNPTWIKRTWPSFWALCAWCCVRLIYFTNTCCLLYFIWFPFPTKLVIIAPYSDIHTFPQVWPLFSRPVLLLFTVLTREWNHSRLDVRQNKNAVVSLWPRGGLKSTHQERKTRRRRPTAKCERRKSGNKTIDTRPNPGALSKKTKRRASSEIIVKQCHMITLV